MVASMVYMGLLIFWAQRVDREYGYQRTELLGSARNRAFAGAALVAAVMGGTFMCEVLLG